MELTIRYHAGVMTLNVDNFLYNTNIKNFKKLLKIIDESYTPEARDVLKNHMSGYLETVDDRLKVYANNVVNARTEYKEQKPVLDALINSRDRYRKNTPPYKDLMQRVKQQREKMQNLRHTYLSNEREFKRVLNRKKFYEKCLELM